MGRGKRSMMNLGTMVKGLASDKIASRLIQHWKHDEGTLKFWRASSNFVYVFEHNQQRYFLRFNSEKERTWEEMKAELDFLNYLKNCGYPCVSTIPTIKKTEIVSEQTSEGTYLAVVFQAANGKMLDENANEQQFEAWGRALAALHSLSKNYSPVGPTRKSWKDVIKKIEGVIKSHPQEHEALEELRNVTELLEGLPTSMETYGLIHYDFQLDNLFYEEESSLFNVIDFDDAMYGWYAIDLVAALDDFLEGDDPFSNDRVQSFLTGYRSVLALDQVIIQQYRTFQRFKNLYTFARLLWSLEDSEMEEAPSWLESVREKFIRVQANLRRGFLSNVNS